MSELSYGVEFKGKRRNDRNMQRGKYTEICGELKKDIKGSEKISLR